MHPLHSPLTFRRGPAMRNRLMLAPMTNRQSHPDGTVSAVEIEWLRRRAIGGFGHIVTCASSVSALGRAFAGEVGVFADRQLPGLRRLAATIHATGTPISVQLNHAGARSLADRRLGPSAEPARRTTAMTLQQIAGVVDEFTAGADRARRAGFDGVQIHAGHGYLVSQFLSRSENRRDDAYGGSLANRSRILFQIVATVREVCGDDMLLGVRLSPERHGHDLFDTLEVAQALLDSGRLDYLDLSLWNTWKPPDDDRSTAPTLFAHAMDLRRGPTRLGVAGRITDAAAARHAIEGGADYVAIGKSAIIHADFPDRAHDPRFRPASRPVTAAHLRREGVGDEFVAFLADGWRDFVAD